MHRNKKIFDEYMFSFSVWRTQEYRKENELLINKIEKCETEINELVQINNVRNSLVIFIQKNVWL